MAANPAEVKSDGNPFGKAAPDNPFGKPVTEDTPQFDAAAPMGDPGFWGGVADVGRGLAHGTIAGLPQQLGKAATFYGAPELGKKLTDFGDEQNKNYPSLHQSQIGQVANENTLSIRGGAYAGGENMPLSTVPGIVGAAGGAMVGGLPGAVAGFGLGSVGALPIFYGSQGQDSKEKVYKAQKEAGASDEVAESESNKAGHLSGAIEAGGELLADAIPFAKLAMPFAKVGVKAVGNLVSTALKPSLKQVGTTLAHVVGGEVATEMGQQAGEAQVEHAYGAGEGATWKDTLSVVVPTVLMSLLPGGLAAGHGYMSQHKRQAVLTDPAADPAERATAAANVFTSIKDQSPTVANAFAKYSADQIAANKPVEVGDDRLYLDHVAPPGTLNADGTRNTQTGQKIDPNAGPISAAAAAAVQNGLDRPKALPGPDTPYPNGPLIAGEDGVVRPASYSDMTQPNRMSAQSADAAVNARAITDSHIQQAIDGGLTFSLDQAQRQATAYGQQSGTPMTVLPAKGGKFTVLPTAWVADQYQEEHKALQPAQPKRAPRALPDPDAPLEGASMIAAADGSVRPGTRRDQQSGLARMQAARAQRQADADLGITARDRARIDGKPVPATFDTEGRPVDDTAPAAAPAKGAAKNLAAMSQDEYADHLRENGLPKGVHAYDALTASPELRGMTSQQRVDHFNQNRAAVDGFRGRVESLWKNVRAGETEGIQAIGASSGWTNFEVGTDEHAKGDDRHKSYAALKDFVGTSQEDLHGFLEAMREGGFNGQVKFPGTGSRALLGFDNIVMHGSTADDAALGEKVARQYFGDRVTGTQSGVDSKGQSHTQTLADAVAADIKAGRKPAPVSTTSEGVSNEESATGSQRQGNAAGLSTDGERSGRADAATDRAGATRSTDEGSTGEHGATQQAAHPAVAEAVARIDQAAHEAATSPKNDLAEPTPAQQQAGNYQKGHINLHGLDISIENPAGSTRKSKPGAKHAWSRTMAHHYGYIRGTVGKDGDHIDAFVGPNPAATRVFVVDQSNPENGRFDEHKVMLGFDSADEARDAYLAAHEKGWKGLQALTETSVEGFRSWITNGATKAPFALQESNPGRHRIEAIKHGIKQPRGARLKAAAALAAQKEAEKAATSTAPAPVTPESRVTPEEAAPVPQTSASVPRDKSTDAERNALDAAFFAQPVDEHGDADRMWQAGFTEDEIDGAIRQSEEQGGQGQAGEAVAGQPAEGGRRTSEAAQDSVLTGETQAEGEARLTAEAARDKAAKKAEAQADAAERARQDAAESKRRAKASVDDFALGQDAEAQLSGQQDMLAAPTTAPAKPKASANTVFTEDAANAARALLKRKLNQLNSGVDPEILQAGITLAGYHIEKGARSFAAFAKAMVEDLGQAIRPHLKSFYMAVKFDPRASGFEGMSTSSEVESASVEAEVEEGGVGLARWRDATLIQRAKMLREAGYTDGDQVRVFSATEWEKLPGAVSHALVNGNLPDLPAAPAAAPAPVTAAPAIVEHVTAKGKTLRGVVRTDLSQSEAKAIDPFTFKKDGGYFIREQHQAAPVATAAVKEEIPAGLVVTDKTTQSEVLGALEAGTRVIRNQGTEFEEESWIEKKNEDKPGETYVVRQREKGATTSITIGPVGPDKQWGWGKTDAARRAIQGWTFGEQTAAAPAAAAVAAPVVAPVAAPVTASTTARPADTFQAQLEQAIADGQMPKDNPALRKLVEAYDGKPAAPARMKAAQEMLEAAIVNTARKLAAGREGPKTTYAQLVRLYESQPLLNVRTSTSIANQAYSTPAPLAWVASQLTGITNRTTVYEPTAGNGMLLIEASPKLAVVNELNGDRLASLQAQGFQAQQHNASTWTPSETVDRVIANPPFGTMKDDEGTIQRVKVDGYTLSQIDHLISARALSKMADDGRATLIIGANKVAGGLSNADLIFFNWLYGHYNVVGHFEVEGDLYARQGASWPVRVISINGRRSSSAVAPEAGTIARVSNWDQVYEQYEQGMGARSVAAESGRGTERPVSDQWTNEPGAVSQPAGVQTGRADPGRPEGSKAPDGNVGGTRADLVVDQPAVASGAVGSSDRAERPGRVDPEQPVVGGNDRDAGAGTVARGNPRTPGVASSDADNQFQTGYTPRSARKDEGVLIPVNMAGPTQDALSVLEDAVGDIDTFAAKELGYKDTDELHQALMGLQVDSVASAIQQIKGGKGVIIADQTGIGKGRQAAAIIRWAARNGHVPVFVTMKPSLFTDMHGDLKDIGSHDIAPFIINSDAWIAGENEERLFGNKAKTHGKALQTMAATGQLPEGRNAVFLTYSQINTGNTQRLALMAIAHRAVFVLDESHNAGGESNTGEFVRGALDVARGVTYLSATYAKRPDNMPLYFKTDMGQAVADDETLMQAMAAGGLPLQTVVSNNLVKAGQLFRRERSYDGVKIESRADTDHQADHEKLSDETTQALRAIVAADGTFHEVFVKAANKELKRSGAKVIDSAGNQAKASVDHTQFTSVVHNFVRQMLLGLKAQEAANRAILALKAGQKPLIAVENTMGSFLSEYAAANGIADGGSLGAFDYRTVLSRALERTRYLIKQAPNGDKIKVNIPLSDLDGVTREAYDKAQRVIDSLAIDIPVSPIDWMRNEITRAGYSVAEITGRDGAVDYSNPKKPTFTHVPALEKSDKVRTTRQFNSGKVDALILNVAGSTGISLHASEKFEDQRPRKMIVAQAAQDINVFMQMLGRVHRTGQVVLPSYELLSAALPAEIRPTALLSGKMKMLNANTSSNTESATSVRAVDMLNKYGDQVIGQYLLDNLELARALDVEAVKEDGSVEEDLARKATGRLSLMPVKVQADFYADVEEQYRTLIDYLNKTNQNELEPRTMDYAAIEQQSAVLFEGTQPTSPFGQDAIYNEYSVKAQGKAMTPVEIREATAAALDGKTATTHANGLVVDLTTALKPFVDGLVERGSDPEMVRKAREVASAGMAFIGEHHVGSMFKVDINGETYNAIVTNLRSTHKKTGNPFSLSKLQVTIAVSGSLRSLTVPATQFAKIQTGFLDPRFNELERLFKEAPANERETVKIVTGNLLGAYGQMESGTRGSIISFTKADGSIEQGILLPKTFNLTRDTRQDYRLKSAADAFKFVTTSTAQNIERFGVSTRDGVVRVLPSGNGISIQVPKSKAKGGKYFLDPKLIAVVGDFVSVGQSMRATVEGRAASEKAIALLMDKQALYVLPSMVEDARSMLNDVAPDNDLMGDIESTPTPAQTKQTGTALFKRWFGNSAVTDASGRPRVMYHGTSQDFSVFDRLASRKWRRAASMDTVGSWFSDKPDRAQQYAARDGMNIMPVYLAIQNPKVYATFNEFLKDMHAAEGRSVPESAPGLGSTEGLRAKLKAEGYDGIQFEQTDVQAMHDEIADWTEAVKNAKDQEWSVPKAERAPYTAKRERNEATLKVKLEDLKKLGSSSTEFDGHDVFVAFESNQIKSAIGNRGTFDPASDDILGDQATSPRSTNPLDRALLDAASRPGATAKALLERIVAESGSAYNRTLAAALLRAGVDSNITFGKPSGGKFKYQDVNFAAAYRPATDTVALFSGNDVEKHLLHELTHAATVRAIKRGGLAAQELRSLMAAVKASGQIDLGLYGLRDEYEFIAEAMSNPAFQEALRAVKVERGAFATAWDSFVNLVRKVLKLQDGNALSEALRIGAQLMRETSMVRDQASGNQVLGSERDPNTPVQMTRITGDEVKTLNSTGEPTRQDAYRWIAENNLRNASFVNADTGQSIKISVKGINEAMSRGVSADQVRSMAAIREIIERAVLAKPEEKPRRPDDSARAVQLFVAPLTIGDRAFRVRMTVRRVAEGDHYYGHQIASIQLDALKEESPATTQQQTPPGTSGGLTKREQARTVTLRELLSGVKTDPDLHGDEVFGDVSMPTIAGIRQNVTDSLTNQKSFNWWHRTIGTQYHKAQTNPLFARVFNAGQTFLQDVSQIAMNAADLAPGLLPKLGNMSDVGRALADAVQPAKFKKMMAAVSKATFQGTLTDKKVYSDAELRSQFGMDDKQVGLYREGRAAIDRMLDEMMASEAVRSYRKDVDGAAVKMARANPRQAVEIMAQALRVAGKEDMAVALEERGDAIQKLKDEGYAPLQRFGKHTVYVLGPNGEQNYFGMYESQREANQAAREMQATFPDSVVTQGIMSDEAQTMFQGISPDTLEIFAEATGASDSAIFQEYLKKVVNNRSALKKMIQRKGIAGFSEDVPRVLAAFVTSSARMASKNYNFGEMTNAVEAIPKEMGDVHTEAARLVKYLQNPIEENAAMRGWLFTHFIGGSIASALTNMTQPIMQTLPYLSQWGAGRAASELAKASALAASGGKLDPVMEAALAEAVKAGIVAPHEIHQLYGESMRGFGSSTAFRSAMKVWGSFFALAETFNRKATFIAAYRIGLTLTPEQLDAANVSGPMGFAEKAIHETQGIYNRGNRPNWARGAVGATLFTFKQFSVSYLEFVKRLPPREKAIAFAILVLAAGAQGLPFAEDIEDLIDTLGQSLGYDTNSKRKLREIAIATLGEGAGSFVMRGVSSIPGMPLDVQGRLGLSNLIPGTSLFKRSDPDKLKEAFEVIGPIGKFVTTISDAIGRAQQGDFRGIATGALPIAFQNAFKGADMLQTGNYRDTKGRVVTKTGISDAIVKSIGFQPEVVARKSGLVNEFYQDQQLNQIVHTQIAERWARGAFERNPEKIADAIDGLKTWNARNPTSPIRIDPADIRRRLILMSMESDVRAIKGAPKNLRPFAQQALQQ